MKPMRIKIINKSENTAVKIELEEGNIERLEDH